MRRIADVEVFSLGLVHAEHLKCRACIAGINFLHVWIFSENFIQLFTVDVLDSAAERDCFFIFRRRNCHIALLHELCIKGFSFCRQKIHSFLVPQHHIDHTGLWMTVCTDRRHRG